MPKYSSDSGTSSHAMSSMRNCAPIVGCTLGLVLVSMAGKVSAQQAAPASAQDSQPEAQQQVGTQAAQAAPAATDNQTASSPTPSNIHAAPAQAPAEAPPASAESGAPPAQAPTAAGQQSMQPNEITEDEIRKLLAGKELFLRGGYLDNILAYNEHGVLIGRAAQGSYTLSGIQIDKVRLTKHKLELEGQRYGLHFLGELPFEDPTTAVDRVNITPKKKVVKITIDRELVVKPKEKKEKEKGKAANTAHQGAAPAAKPSAPGTNSNATAQSAAAPAAPVETGEAGEAQAEIAAAPPEDRPADAKSVTVTTSQAHANGLLTEALGNVFAQGFDDRMMASMPEF